MEHKKKEEAEERIELETVQADPVIEFHTKEAELKEALSEPELSKKQEKPISELPDKISVSEKTEEELHKKSQHELHKKPELHHSSKKPHKLPGFKMPSLAKNVELPKIRMPRIKLKELPSKIRHTLREYKRVIIVSKKPTLEELVKISKVSAIGIILIGIIGFIIQLIFHLFKI